MALNDFLPSHLSLLDKNTTQVPSLLIYLISILSKAIINAFAGECAVNPKAAEPIGTLVAQVFGMEELQYERNVLPVDAGQHHEVSEQVVLTPSPKSRSVSLISILMAKMHKVAPILFGINGPENTPAGRFRLGWRTEGDTRKAFVSEQQHYDRLTGLGAGYASISTRNFSKSRMTNPYPPIHFWQSLSHIVNTKSEEIQTSHLVILKAMFENSSVDRFVLFFGAAAIAALRAALIELPGRLPRETAQRPAAMALRMLADTFKTEKKFSLT